VYKRRAFLSEWLRGAILGGCVGDSWNSDFPRYVWMLRNGRCFEARLVNKEQGTYKGYELDPAQWPQGIERCDE